MEVITSYLSGADFEKGRLVEDLNGKISWTPKE